MRGFLHILQTLGQVEAGSSPTDFRDEDLLSLDSRVDWPARIMRTSYNMVLSVYNRFQQMFLVYHRTALCGDAPHQVSHVLFSFPRFFVCFVH